jgi:alcohol dehydrogenase class IV
MWTFVSPRIVFGEGALGVLEDLQGDRALLITDAHLVSLGLAERVSDLLLKSGMEVHVFDDVEPDPSLQIVFRGQEQAQKIRPDWIIGLGGGSPMDVAKAVRVLYERPELQPAEINPFIPLNLGDETKLVTIPTTSGSGADVTWAIVLTDPEEKRKMGLGNPENLADLAVVDPDMADSMPPQLTADTGFDALTHAVEGFTCTWHKDLTDGLCLQAVRDVMAYLPIAYQAASEEERDQGAAREARGKMHHAATCAGLGFGNAMASTAHAMGHTLGSVFHIPHGRAVGLCLPYTIEFAARESPRRFADLASAVSLQEGEDEPASRSFAEKIRDLARQMDQPLSLAEAGISEEDFQGQLSKLVDDAFNDTQLVTAVRPPSYEELEKLFLYAYRGQTVDF